MTDEVAAIWEHHEEQVGQLRAEVDRLREALDPDTLTEALRVECERRGDWYGGTVGAVASFLRAYARGVLNA